jgi:uncharacterized protein (TIGR03067 family)
VVPVENRHHTKRQISNLVLALASPPTIPYNRAVLSFPRCARCAMKKLLVLLVVLFPLPAGAGDDGKKEIGKVQGTWIMTQLKHNGRDISADEKTKFKLVFKGDLATVEGDDDLKKEYAKVTFKFDPAATPKLVDMKIIAGSQKDAVIEGIYQLKGDEFKICANVFGNSRPTEFDAPEGSSMVLVVMKREAK